jgi:hypothetical protein
MENKDKNGWTKVSSEADLPTEDCRYWIANKNGVFDFFVNKGQVAIKFKNETLTHYKKLVETLPPVEYTNDSDYSDCDTCMYSNSIHNNYCIGCIDYSLHEEINY